MRFLLAIVASAAVHASLIALLFFFFGRNEDPDRLAKLDLSSVELSLTKDEVERIDENFDAPPAPPDSNPADMAAEPGGLRVEEDDCEVVVTVPEAEPLKIPVADDPAPPKMDMPDNLKRTAEEASGPQDEESAESAVATKASGGSATSRPEEKSPVKVRVEAKLKKNSFREPEYPKASRRRGEKGEVRLKLGINVKGLVESVEVVGSTGFKLLDDAAAKAAKAAKFIPASIDGEAVFSTTEIKFVFKLK